MLEQVLNRAAEAARTILYTPGLPPEARPLIDRATDFPRSLEPDLRRTAQSVRHVALAARETGPAVTPEIDSWKAGDQQARSRITSVFENLNRKLDEVLGSNQTCFRRMTHYREQVLADQRALGSLVEQLQHRRAALNAERNSRQSELDKQQTRLRILYGLSLGIGWVVSEIASLIASGKGLQQQLGEMQQQLDGMARAEHHAQQASDAAQSFSRQLQLLEESVRNLMQATSVTDGQMAQLVGSLKSGGASTTPIVVQAYLNTLNGQAANLLSFVGMN